MPWYPTADDPLRNTRTTKASLIERTFIAPYFVNYHLEHHLLIYVPCYNLPEVACDPDAAARMPPAWKCSAAIWSVLRLATALRDAEDRPGAIVNNARRMRGGARIGEDQASAGF